MPLLRWSSSSAHVHIHELKFSEGWQVPNTVGARDFFRGSHLISGSLKVTLIHSL